MSEAWQDRLITALGGDDGGGNLDWQERIIAKLVELSGDPDPNVASPRLDWVDRVVSLLGGDVENPENLNWQERIIQAAGGAASANLNWQDRMVLAFEGVSFGPTIALSALTIPEDAEEDEVIGTASISGSYTGTPEWSLSGDDTDKVQINSSTGVYSVAGALDFETQPELNVVFEVTGVDPVVPNKPAAISVTDVEDEGFAPTDISNCAVWLDFSDTATITDAGAGAVSAVTNKANGSNNATQGTGGARPTTGIRTINSLNALDFDAGDSLNLATNIARGSGYTVFAVGEFDAVNIFQILFGGSTGSFGFRVDNVARPQILRTGQATILTYTSPTVSAATPTILAARTVSSSNQIYLNGGSPATNTTDPAYSADAGQIGSGVNGGIGEVIVYTGVLNASDMNLVGEYLEAKWGVSWATVS